MKKPNPYLFLFLLLLVPFSVYIARGSFIGNDGYGFLLFVCSGENLVGLQSLPLAVFSLMPCNALFIKGILFLLAFISGYFILKLCSLFAEDWWRASYLIFLSSVFVLEFVKFENDQFAYPFLFASLYFFYKGLMFGRRKSFVKSLVLLGIAGLLWQGSVFYLLSFTFNAFALAIVSIPILIWKRSQIVGAIVRGFEIAEDMPFQFHLHFILNFGLLGAILEPVLTYQALFLFALGAISNKFWVLSLPFLVVGMVLLLKKLEGMPQMRWFNPQLFAIVLAGFCLFGVTQSIMLNPPTESHWKALAYARTISDDVEVDWSYGYWARWFGIQTESYGSPHNQRDFSAGQIVVSKRGLETCTVLETFGRISVYQC